MEELFREALALTFWIALPILAALLIAALLMSVFQAATQILEPTLSFVPKALVLTAVIILLGAWMGGRLVEFARHVLESFPGLIQ